MSALDAPLTFEPIFFERIWGGRKLASVYQKKVPPDCRIGESWEIVDRPQAQSVVRSGALAGRSLHDLWVNARRPIFGNVPDVPRFPLLIKLLDCREKLSLQVHPPPNVAEEEGGEPKTECWYIAEAEPEAALYVGLRERVSAELFRQAVASGTAAVLIHRVRVSAGDAFLIPSGRVHAIGAGNLIVEVQQNSDTTFRVFDWNRTDENGSARQLHVDQALSCIDFNDTEPTPLKLQGETILSHELFTIERWQLDRSRQLGPAGTFAVAFCLSGKVICGKIRFRPGDFFLLPAAMEEREVEAAAPDTSLLRIAI